MRECRFTVLVDWDEDANCWVGHVPALNWMSDFGATRQELLDRMVEAITGYLEALDKEGLPIPTSDPADPLLRRGSRGPRNPPGASTRGPAISPSPLPE